MSAYNIGWIWDQNVSPTQKLVLFALNEHTNMSHGDWRIWPSVKNIMRLTGLSERAIRSAVTELSEMGLITVCAQHDPNTGRQLSNIYYLTAPFPGGEGANAAGGRVQMPQGEGANAAPLEPSYKNPVSTDVDTKAIRLKFDPLDCPSFINREAWAEWVDYRKDKRKPISATAAKKTWSLLSTLSEQDQAAAIAHSIRCDYQGIFPNKKPNDAAHWSTQGLVL
jgi:hypothetical protein